LSSSLSTRLIAMIFRHAFPVIRRRRNLTAIFKTSWSITTYRSKLRDLPFIFWVPAMSPSPSYACGHGHAVITIDDKIYHPFLLQLITEMHEWEKACVIMGKKCVTPLSRQIITGQVNDVVSLHTHKA
jgi:hypothetical protein